MRDEDMKKLKIGDVVRHVGTGYGYIIIKKHPVLTGIRTIHITNSSEWELVTYQDNPPD